jgi:recombination protein RecT
MTTANPNTQIEKVSKSIVEVVTDRVAQLTELGQIHLPKDYSAPNAVRAAWLLLQDQKNRDGKLVLSVATKDSVINAMFKMVISGLSVVKKQGDFILYGDKLSFQPEYHGNKALVKRFCEVLEVTHNTIYEADEFEYIIDKHGRKQISKHVQKLQNIDPNKIIGAYATVVFADGTTQSEVMTIARIKKSWMQGPMKGQSPAHLNFPDAMSEKTAANKLMTSLINASDDGAILEVNKDEEEGLSPAQKADEKAKVAPKAIAFDEATIIQDEAPEMQETEETAPPATQEPEKPQANPEPPKQSPKSTPKQTDIPF